MDDPAIGAADLAPDEPGGRRRWLVGIAKAGFTVAVVVAVGYATARQWVDVRDTLLALSVPTILLSLTMVILGLLAQTRCLKAAFADLGHPVNGATAAHIYLIGLLGKYLPGSVWTFVMQMEMGKRAGIPRDRALLAPIIGLGLSTTSAVLLALFVLPALGGAGTAVVGAVLVISVAALVCAHPRVLTWLVQRLLALTRRPPLTTPLTWRAVALIFGWSTVAWVCFGVHLWLLADGTPAAGQVSVLRCVGAFALGMTAGILAFLSPSGIGVRESIIVAALLPHLDPGVALGMALASRLIFTMGDLAAAGIAVVIGSRRLGLRRQNLPEPARPHPRESAGRPFAGMSAEAAAGRPQDGAERHG